MIKKMLILVMMFLSVSVFAQSKANDIHVGQLPTEVKTVLNKYIEILTSSESLDDCEKRMTEVAGGGLVNESDTEISLRGGVKPYSLKKDFNNIKFYKTPVVITRVNKNPNKSTDGFGASAISGTVYKIWIAKKEGVAGMPAPISILVPDGHPTIKTPKIVGIGSL